MIGPDDICPKHPDVAAATLLALEGLPADLSSCRECSKTWSRLKHLRELGRSLPWEEPDGARVERMRAAVLDAFAGPRLSTPRAEARPWNRRSVVFTFSLASLCALALILAGGGARPRAPTPAPQASQELAVVQAIDGARFERVSAPPDETVHVSEGRVHVEVVHLNSGQRFRILTADATVEVRGTEFDVQVAGDHLQTVAVDKGLVEVRSLERPTLLLRPGERWQVRAKSPMSPLPGASTPAETAPPSRRGPSGERHKGPRVASPEPLRPEPRTSSAEPVPNEVPGQDTNRPATSPASAIPGPAPVSGSSPATRAPAPVQASPTKTEGSRQEAEDRRQDRREERRERRQEMRQERLDRRR
jgi:hypothetical protein